MANSVWFIGHWGSKTITSSDWASAGFTASSVTWSAENGWSVPESVFTTDQLIWLSGDAGFLLGQSGARGTPSPGPDLDNYELSAYAYFLKARDLYNRILGVIDEAGGLPGGDTVPWGSITGKPTSFPPAAHTHTQGDISGLESLLADMNTVLDTKADGESVNTALNSFTTVLNTKASTTALTDAVNTINISLNGKATPSDISTAVSGLLGGVGGAGNTLKKLYDLIVAFTGVVPPLVFSESTGWPTRSATTQPVFWIGGDAPEDKPTGMVDNDVWIPTTGDNVDLGPVVEAFQLIAGTANTIPYFSATNVFSNLVIKTAMSGTALDTNVLTELAVKTYVLAQIALVTTNGTLTGATLTNPTETVYDDGNSGASKTLAALSSGSMRKVTLTANTALTIPAPVGGKSLLVAVHTGAGSFTASWASASGAIRWPSGAAPVITTTASRVDYITFVSHDGVNWYGSYAQNYTV